MTYLSHDILCPIRLELGEREREVNDLEFKLEKVSALPTVSWLCVWWIFLASYPGLLTGLLFAVLTQGKA